VEGLHDSFFSSKKVFMIVVQTQLIALFVCRANYVHGAYV
jgi:hypothetical protein